MVNSFTLNLGEVYRVRKGLFGWTYYIAIGRNNLNDYVIQCSKKDKAYHGVKPMSVDVSWYDDCQYVEKVDMSVVSKVYKDILSTSSDNYCTGVIGKILNGDIKNKKRRK